MAATRAAIPTIPMPIALGQADQCTGRAPVNRRARSPLEARRSPHLRQPTPQPATNWRDGQIDSVCRNLVKSRKQKYSALQKWQESSQPISARATMRGRLRNRHGTLARVAMDARCVSRVQTVRTRTRQRTAKSCGPGAATLASIRPARAGTATVTIKAAHRGEHEVSRKAIARGKPGCLGCTCGLTQPMCFS
jgi:hypothetical protein